MTLYAAIADSRDRGSWLSARALGIGASEIAGVLGESPWSSPLSIYRAKVAPEPEPEEQAERLFWGLELEEAIARGFSKRTGRDYNMAGKLLRSADPNVAWAICTLDAWTGNASGETWPLEIKNVSEFAADQWLDGAPRHVYLQCQHQMLVTGEPAVTVAALLGGCQLVWEDVERNEQEIRRIVAQGGRFWRDHVEARVPPPADGHRATRNALLSLHPCDDGGAVPLPAGMCDLDEERAGLKATISQATKRLTEIDNLICQHLGDATAGELPDGTVYTWKQQTRRAYTVAESTTRVLRRKAAARH